MPGQWGHMGLQARTTMARVIIPSVTFAWSVGCDVLSERCKHLK
jgi:hypothetical protein